MYLMVFACMHVGTRGVCFLGVVCFSAEPCVSQSSRTGIDEMRFVLDENNIWSN